MAICRVEFNIHNSKIESCGDKGLNINQLLTTDVSNINSVDEFQRVITSELIDVKNRKTITSYPTLKALYERYRYGFQGTPTSSGFDYVKMGSFVKLVGTYWVDLLEQVIPSTTIWGSTYKYRNTIFDNNKFQYKKYTLFVCSNPDNIMYPSPVSAYDYSIETSTVDVSNVDYNGQNCLTPNPEATICNGVLIRQMDFGSEFIGSVTSIATPSTGDTVIIGECDLIINDILFSDTNDNKLLANPQYMGGTAPYTYQWVITNQTGLFASWYIVSGTEDDETVYFDGPFGQVGKEDDICVSLTMADAAGCSYTLNKCARANPINV